MSDLFREEVVRHASRRLSGDVVLATPPSFRLLAFVAAGIVLFVALFVCTATYARKETVPGWVTPDAGMIRLSARQGGTVEVIHVREGDAVRTGQPIATLRLSSELSGGDAYEALRKALAAQTAAAGSRAAAAREVLVAEHRQLVERRAALGRELIEARRRLTLQQQRVELAKIETDRAETIASKGFLPRRELDARRSSALAEDQALSELNAAALSVQREIGEVSARLEAIPIDIQAAVAEAEAVTAELDQQRTETESQASYVVVAAVSGRVAALPVQRGQTVAPNTSIAVLTPEGSTLEAELYAPSRAAGFIREGQPVRLMYQAFPHQKFGAGAGVVDSVSMTVLAPAEVSIPGLQFQEPMFRVRVQLARDSVSAYGETLPLQPGMLLSADVVIDRRSLLEWLLDPLYAAGRR